MARKSPSTNLPALRRAVDLFESQEGLAKALGVGQSLIAMWFFRSRVPAEYCPAIERATARKVRCEELRPDIDWAILREQVA